MAEYEVKIHKDDPRLREGTGGILPNIDMSNPKLVNGRLQLFDAIDRGYYTQILRDDPLVRKINKKLSQREFYEAANKLMIIRLHNIFRSRFKREDTSKN